MWASPVTLHWLRLRDSWLWGHMGLSQELSERPQTGPHLRHWNWNLWVGLGTGMFSKLPW